MTNEHDRENEAFDQVFVADPADADLFEEDDLLPRWPKVVGIISIVIGGFFTLCGAAVPAQGWLNKQFLGGLQGGAPDVLLNPPTMTYVAGAFGIITTIILLVAGILCVLRNPSCRRLFLVYGCLSVVSFLWSVSIQLDTHKQINEWTQRNPDADYSKMMQQQGAAGPLIGIGCTAIIGLPWPAFCLFWFGFVKRKPEDFTGGADLEVL